MVSFDTMVILMLKKHFKTFKIEKTTCIKTKEIFEEELSKNRAAIKMFQLARKQSDQNKCLRVEKIIYNW